MHPRPRVRVLFASAILASTLALGGCNYEGTAMMPGRAMAPLSDKMLADLEQKNMAKDSPILVRIFKSESELEVWKKDRNGDFALLKSYPICRWSGDLGPKVREGDRQAPEGFYSISPGQMNPNSSYYLAFNMGYPNAFDKSLGRTGAQLMVHGDCSSRGCYAMSDEQISEIYALGRESFFGGQKAFQVQAYPFHMTADNMAKHRNSPHMAFWKMIKEGSDHFEVTRQEPKVDVCEKRYVFNAATPGDASRAPNFSPAGKCPVYEIPREIASAVNDRKRQDEFKIAEATARGAPVVASRAGIDGGMHPVWVAKLQGGVSMDADGHVVVADNSGIQSRVGVVPPANVAIAPVTAPAPVVLASASARPAKTAAPSSMTGLVGSIFASNQPQAEAAAPVETKVAKSKPVAPRTVVAARPKSDTGLKSSVAANAAPPSHNVFPAARASVVAEAQPKRDEPKRDESVPGAGTRTAYASSPEGGSTFLTGAQPAAPVGSFNSRWSGFR